MAKITRDVEIRATDELAEAIEIVDEAIVWVRQGLGTDSKAELARSLTTKAILLNEIRRHEEALTCITEAVEIRRQLAQSNPVFRPMLARSLNVQAIVLAQERAQFAREQSSRPQTVPSDYEFVPGALELLAPEQRDPEIELIQRAVDTIGFPRVVQWMQAPVPSLHGRTPYSLMGSETGRNEVETVLGSIEHGIF